VEHAHAAKGAELIIEASPAQFARLTEEQETREVVCGLALVEFTSLAPPVVLLVDRTEDVDRAVHAPDLVQRLVHAVLARVPVQPMQDQRGRRRSSLNRGNDANRFIPCAAEAWAPAGSVRTPVPGARDRMVALWIDPAVGPERSVDSGSRPVATAPNSTVRPALRSSMLQPAAE
jgi:hypothetical protein